MLLRAAVLAAALLAIPMTASASPFCDGFKAGWNAAFKERNRTVQTLPTCPNSSSSTYAGGYEAGLLAALRSMR